MYGLFLTCIIVCIIQHADNQWEFRPKSSLDLSEDFNPIGLQRHFLSKALDLINFWDRKSSSSFQAIQ